MQRKHRLLLDILDRHEAHRRSRYGLTDRVRVSGIVRVALDVRLDELRGRHSARMSQCLPLARPVVRAGTGLGTNQTERQVGEEGRGLVAALLLTQLSLAAFIDTVTLEHFLGQIKANRRNLHGGRSFRIEWLLKHPLWHFNAVYV